MNPFDMWSAILHAYKLRACFVCGCYGECVHREPEVEQTYIERARRMPAQTKTAPPAPAAVVPYVNGVAS